MYGVSTHLWHYPISTAGACGKTLPFVVLPGVAIGCALGDACGGLAVVVITGVKEPEGRGVGVVLITGVTEPKGRGVGVVVPDGPMVGVGDRVTGLGVGGRGGAGIGVGGKANWV